MHPYQRHRLMKIDAALTATAAVWLSARVSHQSLTSLAICARNIDIAHQRLQPGCGLVFETMADTLAIAHTRLTYLEGGLGGGNSSAATLPDCRRGRLGAAEASAHATVVTGTPTSHKMVGHIETIT